MREDRSPILELQGITKSFGGVEALRGVDFALSHPARSMVSSARTAREKAR
ncbi:ABC-type sugar transport system ATPase subunit [Bradyrhizobium sp. GM2.4]